MGEKKPEALKTKSCKCTVECRDIFCEQHGDLKVKNATMDV